MGKKHCTVGFIAAGQAFADGYHGTVHPFTYDFNYCTMPGQWCQHNTKCCTKKDFLYFCVNFWAICQNSVQASFLPAEHILQTFYFCCCHSRFAFRQHRTIPALRLKHRSDSCGTASALPKCSIMSGCGTRIVLRGQKPLALCDRCPCFGSLFPSLAALTFAASSIICAFGLASVAPRSPYRHLELCGIAQSKTAVPPLWERPPLQTIRCHAFSFIFAEQSLHSAQHIVLLFISANLLVDIIVQFFYCVSPLCIIHVDLFPWPRWF